MERMRVLSGEEFKATIQNENDSQLDRRRKSYRLSKRFGLGVAAASLILGWGAGVGVKLKTDNDAALAGGIVAAGLGTAIAMGGVEYSGIYGANESVVVQEQRRRALANKTNNTKSPNS